MNHKKAVLKKHPNATCYMSQLSGMFFVVSHRKSNGRRNILAWEPHPSTAWKQAHVNPRTGRGKYSNFFVS